jgi:dienelactone hydrolase
MAQRPQSPATLAAAPASARRRRLWLGLLLFVLGLVAGMAAARYRLPPYAQLDRLHDRYLVDRPAHGPTPSELFRTDPRRLIALRSPQDVVRLRAEVVRFLWGEEGLPAGPPQRVERGVAEARFDGLAHLERVDRLTTRMDYGLVSVGYHLVPARPNGALVLYHHGHTAGSARDKARIGRLLVQGHAVVELFMPLYGPNSRPRLDLPRIGRFRLTRHDHMRLLAPAQGHPLQYFYEPAIRAVNHLAPHYDRIAIMGYSGGGRTALIAAALDPRIRASFVVASFYPYYLMADAPRLGDYDESDPALYRLATHLELMVLAASGEGRRSVQILNRYDPCCFAGRRAEAYAPTVRRAVQRLGPGDFTAVADETGREHDISPRAMDLVLARLAEMR